MPLVTKPSSGYQRNQISVCPASRAGVDFSCIVIAEERTARLDTARSRRAVNEVPVTRRSASASAAIVSLKSTTCGRARACTIRYSRRSGSSSRGGGSRKIGRGSGRGGGSIGPTSISGTSRGTGRSGSTGRAAARRAAETRGAGVRSELIVARLRRRRFSVSVGRAARMRIAVSRLRLLRVAIRALS